MEKWIEATGRTEDAAVHAPAQLGLDRTACPWRFWAGKRIFRHRRLPAKSKVTHEVPDETPRPSRRTLSAPQKEKAPKEEPKRAVTRPRPPRGTEAPLPPKQRKQPPRDPCRGEAVDYEARIRAFLAGLLEQMGVEATITVGPRTENGIPVTLDGPKLGAVIGHRGETLDAIQQLTNYTVNRGRTHRVRIHIDAENYRAKREESLRRLASKVAAKVVKYRRNITVEPATNAYERHVITRPSGLPPTSSPIPRELSPTAARWWPIPGASTSIEPKTAGRKPLHRRFRKKGPCGSHL